ncbi:hypothetical protein K470DRAFT_209788 [Piedraia hortae CBS 480.64]|uniref:Ribosomal protein L9 domain-containing protein n=1 Tax=Piedraia hortae CBS 480.64 TaxID=1314780 RepID=A0A6A7C8M1_9PEZI|nr:hypothetical protein K470DRAFT_209788 [Piedraia hortae CBS 480.64]
MSGHSERRVGSLDGHRPIDNAFPGTIVPISPGLMRNRWFPTGTAEYLTQQEIKHIIVNKIPVHRNNTFGIEEKPIPVVESVKTNTAELREASMFQKTDKAPIQMTPERTVQLLDKCLPENGMKFFRQVVFEEDPLKHLQGAGTLDLLKARAIRKEAVIFDAVTTADVFAAVKKAMADNEEAALAMSFVEKLTFVGSEEADKVKRVGDYMVEMKLKDSDETVRKKVCVVAQE